jgi:hypothetical protein
MFHSKEDETRAILHNDHSPFEFSKRRISLMNRKCLEVCIKKVVGKYNI